MAIYTLENDEKAGTHLWKITWYPGTYRSGSFVISYSMSSIRRWLENEAAPHAYKPETLQQSALVRFHALATTLQDHLDDPNDDFAKKIQKQVILKPAVKNDNGEVTIEIAPASASLAVAPAAVLRAVLEQPRPFNRISPCSNMRRMVPEAFTHEDVLTRAIQKMERDGGPGSLLDGLKPKENEQKNTMTMTHAAGMGGGSFATRVTQGEKNEAQR